MSSYDIYGDVIDKFLISEDLELDILPPIGVDEGDAPHCRASKYIFD